MKYLSLIYLFMSISSFASSTWQENVRSILPAPLKEFISGKTKLSEIENKLGKAQLIKGKNYYWKFDGLKYALELRIESKTLKSLHFTFTGKKPDLKIIQDQIKIEKFSPYPKEGKSSGRFLRLEENGSELVIDPVSKTIYSVRLP